MAGNFRQTGANADGKADGRRSGFTVDPGPYEATVIGHVTGSRMGQLIVSIPDWSGADGPDLPMSDNGGDTADGVVVSYASPFFGQSYGTDSGTNPNTPYTAGQSYGMWMIPPDIGCTVLVTFVAGDLSRGYWFACVYNTPNHHMVPGLGRAIGGPANGTLDPKDQLSQYLDNTSVLPVVEGNLTDTFSSLLSGSGLAAVKRYPHENQAMTLIAQGLDEDPVRGAISSSSLRESPSNVYGISTPGRKGGSTDQVKGAPQKVYYRTGGHQFVMDDGAAGDDVNTAGTDQLIRLRTAGGHQILMNDTSGDGIVPDGPSAPGVLYIGSKSGSHWLEFSVTGAINVYGQGGFNLRTQGPMNFHSDSSITMTAGSISMNAIASKKAPLPSISINSGGTLAMGAMLTASLKANGTLSLSAIGKASLTGGAAVDVSGVGAVSVSAGGALMLSAAGVTSVKGTVVNLNTPPGPGKPPTPPLPVLLPKTNPLPETSYSTKWLGGDVLRSSCSVVPTHEPWPRYSPNEKQSIINNVQDSAAAATASTAAPSSTASSATDTKSTGV